MSLKTKINNMIWEVRLRINTRGMKEIPDQDSFRYSTISYSAIFSILRSLQLKPFDVFVDIGCGKGRVVCCASRFKIKEVIGIDINYDLCEIAKKNAASLRGWHMPITIINSPAQDINCLKGTVYFLFNPFGASTLKKVLSKISSSMDLNPRFAKIVYVNPLYESVLSDSDLFEIYNKWSNNKSLANEHNVSFYKTKSLSIDICE